MRVIVTRPLDSGRRTAEKLRQLGHEPVLLPLTQPRHHRKAVAEALAKRPAAIAFTSAEAIRAVSPADIEAHGKTPVFTVGEASAEAARKAGFLSVTAGPGTGELLAQQLAEKRIGALLYLAGSPRSPAFEEGLATAGLGFQTVTAYDMQETEWSLAELDSLCPRPDAVLFYSRQAARLFLNHKAVSQRLGHLSGIHAPCLSAQVADAIPAESGLDVAVAANPTEDDLLLLLSSRLEPKSL